MNTRCPCFDKPWAMQVEEGGLVRTEMLRGLAVNVCQYDSIIQYAQWIPVGLMILMAGIDSKASLMIEGFQAH